MAKQKMSTKKKASAAVAGGLAVALAVGGAYAWTDYSQDALNTFKGTVAADVLLHDDFDGENKDVYVENTGDNAVFVRVKFAEYLQIGNNSVLDSPAALDDESGLDLDGDGVADTEYLGKTKAQPGDILTWPVHQFTNADAENKCGSSTHTYFAWNMSGLQKAYLSGVTEASSNGYGGLTKAQFDALTVGAEVTLGDITTKKMMSATDSEIMMLSDWLAAETKPAGARWLLDTDGWAYWSDALAPDSATNLLLDEVLRVENSAPYDNWVYNIDVQLQAATLNELDYWYANGVADVASADNSVATVTADGLAFIKLKAGDAITSADGTVIGADSVRYISVGNNVYGVAKMKDDGTGYEADPDQGYVLAGNDLLVGNEDDNMLAGRSADNNGGIEIGTVVLPADGAATLAEGDAITEPYYTIAGAEEDFYVTVGIDKKLGTYDDVIRSKTGALGQYDIDGGTEGGDDELEYMGWNYLGGDLENMLVATEYVLDNVQFNSDNTNPDAYKYQGSLIETKINEIGAAFITNGMDSSIVNTVELDMSAAQHKGNHVYICTDTASDHVHNVSGDCASISYAPYYTDTDPQDNIPDTQFFALSLAEVFDAYGDNNEQATRNVRAILAAPKFVRKSDNLPSGNWYTNTQIDGEGNLIVTTIYWLRSPGYSASRAARVTASGSAYASSNVNYLVSGARPACYMNLSASN